MSLIDLLYEYSELQCLLSSAVWQLKPNQATDERHYYLLPRNGQFEIGQESWFFQRHGAGIKFVRKSDQITVDAHKFIDTHPRIFDAWRLEQFLESRKVSCFVVGKKIFTSDFDSIRAALDQLELNGALLPSDADSDHYELA